MAVRMRAWRLGLCVACLLFFICPALAETAELSISLPETVRGYTPCEIVIRSPAEGEAELKLFDMTQNLWLVRKEQLKEGENILPWDGLGEYGERMFAGPYRFVVKLKTADGKELAKEKKFNISGTTETLVYALPSSETLYLEGGDKWFVECYVSAKCLVAMEVKDSKGETVYFRDESIRDPDGISLYWNGALDSRRKIAPGEYTVRMWSKLNPDYDHTFPLTVKEKAPEKAEAAFTAALANVPRDRYLENREDVDATLMALRILDVLGQLASDRGDTESVRRFYEQARSLSPDHRATANLGKLLDATE